MFGYGYELCQLNNEKKWGNSAKIANIAIQGGEHYNGFIFATQHHGVSKTLSWRDRTIVQPRSSRGMELPNMNAGDL